MVKTVSIEREEFNYHADIPNNSLILLSSDRSNNMLTMKCQDNFQLFELARHAGGDNANLLLFQKLSHFKKIMKDKLYY